ncbi:MAG TPA: patatin-like phospholipase family protein [Pyrinomonadaceae bacterium]|nr:patatin-like phospholipase family protein [Pyrinomonadaceae bacterium]
MAKFDMVFEGGGAKGSVFVGALEVLQQNGHTHRRLIGTSAGAITVALVAAGYKPQEMLAAVNERLPNGKPRFSSFMDPPVASDFSDEQRDNSETMEALAHVDIPLVPERLERRVDRRLLDHLLEGRAYCHLFSLVECGGFFAGNNFLKWLIEKLGAKGIAADVTFPGFFAQTGTDLSLVASDTSDVEMLVLNHRTAPDLPIAWAVRMSMSIPFVWREVVWRAEWGLYRDRKKTGNIIVDGGVLSNFPIRLIDVQPAADPEIASLMGNTDADAAKNLGLLIDETLAVAGDANTIKTPLLLEHARTVQRLGRLVDTMMGAQDNDEIRAHESEICRLPAKGYGTTEFDMSQERLDALVEAGRNAMRVHLT